MKNTISEIGECGFLESARTLGRWERVRRGGRASVSAPQSSNEGSGLPRVDFPEEAPDEGLEEIGWGDETLTLARG